MKQRRTLRPFLSICEQFFERVSRGVNASLEEEVGRAGVAVNASLVITN
jgi:hypothetical protein